MNPNSSSPLTPHLTIAQLDAALALRAGRVLDPAVSAHLEACPRCASELAALGGTLLNFRSAATAYAERSLRRIPARPAPAHRHRPALWVAAAAALSLAAVLPLQTLHKHAAPPAPIAVQAPQTHTAESDEALLESVSSEVSADVPAPMQALADPSATSSASSTQRKD